MDLTQEVYFSPSSLLVASLDQHVVRLSYFLALVTKLSCTCQNIFFFSVKVFPPFYNASKEGRVTWLILMLANEVCYKMLSITCLSLSKSYCHYYSELNGRIFFLYQSYSIFNVGSIKDILHARKVSTEKLILCFSKPSN